MTTAKFRFSSDILIRLGEELNPSADQSILELVKNAYDANALTCTIELIDSTQPGGTIRIVDDGDGMTSSQITDGWLVLGRSSKSSKQRTRLGRVPAGSKGLGRLAALRMGKRALVHSISEKAPNTRTQLEIDWERFERGSLVDDVDLTIKQRRIVRSVPGTTIEILNLRNAVRLEDVTRLARALVLLADPFGTSRNGFQPRLLAPEFKRLETLVAGRYFKQAHLHLTATLLPSGKAKATFKDASGKILFQGTHEEIKSKKRDGIYNAPEAKFDLYMFNLTRDTFSLKDTTIGEVKDWLKAFGGVHVYQDDIRVAPYGNPGNDWLDLNLRRAQSPEERPSTNNSIGRVQLKNNGKENSLIQKTDRSGFIEDENFDELKSFLKDCLEWLAKNRLSRAEDRRQIEREQSSAQTIASRQKIASALERTEPKERIKLELALKEYERARDKETAALRKEIQLYRTLSTAGIIAATFAHESSGNPIKTIRTSTTTIERRSRGLIDSKTYEDKLKTPIERVKGALDSLAVIGNTTLSLVQSRKRAISGVDVHSVIEAVLANYDPLMKEYGIDLLLELTNQGRPTVKAALAAIESIVANLVNNSIYFLQDSTQRQLLVSTLIQGNKVEIIFSDSGPGIKDISVRDIWLPGESTRPDGTGFGLTIVRDTVTDLNGQCSVTANGRHGGAEFSIVLPLA